MMGCGFDSRYKGRSAIAQDAGLHGICPGWYREQAFFEDVTRYIRLRRSVSLEPTTPKRIWDVMFWSDVFEAERSNQLAKETDNA